MTLLTQGKLRLTRVKTIKMLVELSEKELDWIITNINRETEKILFNKLIRGIYDHIQERRFNFLINFRNKISNVQ